MNKMKENKWKKNNKKKKFKRKLTLNIINKNKTNIIRGYLSKTWNKINTLRKNIQ